MLTENGTPNLWSASRSKTRARACASAKIRKKNSARGKTVQGKLAPACEGLSGASVRRAPRRYRLFCAAGCAFAQANIGLARGGRPALGRNILANIGGFPRGKIHLPLARPAYRALFPVALLPYRTMLGNISARIAGYAGCCGFLRLAQNKRQAGKFADPSFAADCAAKSGRKKRRNGGV